MLGREVTGVACFQQRFVKFGDACIEIFLFPEKHPCLIAAHRHGVVIKSVAQVEHAFFDLAFQNIAHAAEVVAYCIDFNCRTHEVFEVAVEITRFGISHFGKIAVLADGMPDFDGRVCLPMAVDASVALLHDIGIPRDFEMNHIMAVVLQIDAFGGGIRRNENAHAGYGRGGLERGFDGLALVAVHAAV